MAAQLCARTPMHGRIADQQSRRMQVPRPRADNNRGSERGRRHQLFWAGAFSVCGMQYQQRCNCKLLPNRKRPAFQSWKNSQAWCPHTTSQCLRTAANVNNAANWHAH
jgi:hypothetical protein